MLEKIAQDEVMAEETFLYLVSSVKINAGIDQGR
jgi:hypothetical protein